MHPGTPARMGCCPDYRPPIQIAGAAPTRRQTFTGGFQFLPGTHQLDLYRGTRDVGFGFFNGDYFAGLMRWAAWLPPSDSPSHAFVGLAPSAVEPPTRQ